MPRPPQAGKESGSAARGTLQQYRATAERLQGRLLAQNANPPQGAANDDFLSGKNVLILPKTKLAGGKFEFDGVSIRAAVTSVGGQDTGQEDSPYILKQSDLPKASGGMGGVSGVRIFGAWFSADVQVALLNHSKNVASLEVGYVQNITKSPVRIFYRAGDKEIVGERTFSKLPILDAKSIYAGGFAEQPTPLSGAVAGPILVSTTDPPVLRVAPREIEVRDKTGATIPGRLTRVEGSRTFTLTFRVRNRNTDKHLDLLRITIDTLYDVAVDAAGRIIAKSRKVSVIPRSTSTIKPGDKAPVDTIPLAVVSEINKWPKR